jgi:transcriptional regulatory protein RtcR
MRRPLTVFSFLGTTVDVGSGTDRWERWRPTVSLGQFEDLRIDKLVLWCDQARNTGLIRTISADLGTVSPETAVEVRDFRLADPWDFEQVFSALLDFVRDYPFAPEREDYLLHITTGTHVAQICLFLLCESRHFPARLLQTAPPRGGRRTGETRGSWSIIDLDLSRYDGIAKRFAHEQADRRSLLKAGIHTRSASFNQMIEEIELVAVRSTAPILLMGPTGAGKSFLAKRVYELKRGEHRVSGAFVEINCATLRGDQAMSALFGHLRGAYTGAGVERHGLLRAAHQGVLFLDEIGELGVDEQAMLLKAIEDKRFLPVGSDKEVSSDFQLIAGTNRDLALAVAAGRFRDDLYARLNLWTFELPGLKDRRQDIEPNLDFELERFEKSSGNRVTMNQEARGEYLRFALDPSASWPGNFRDLSGSVTRMATLALSGRIQTEHVSAEISRLKRQWRGHAGTALAAAGADDLLARLELPPLDRFDQVQLAEVVRVCRASRSVSDAARALFAESLKARTSRNDADRLRKYLARFKLSFELLRD